MHTEIKTALALGLPAAALLALAACGGGGGSATTSGGGQGPIVTMPTDPTEPATPAGPTTLPPAREASAGEAPLVLLGNELRVGAVAPPSGLPAAGRHGAASVRHGRLADGVGAAHLTAYLRHDLTEGAPQAFGMLLRFATAPVVRYVAGTSAGHVDEIVRAVRHLNAHLPRDFQLAVDPTPVSAAGSEASTDIRDLAHGQILIQYARSEDWDTDTYIPAGVRGAAHRLPSLAVPGRIEAARVWIDHTRIDPAFTINTLIHEMVHAFGRLHSDPARFPDSTMSQGTYLAPAEGYPVRGLDGEALLAVHSVLEAGDDPALIATKLGPWESGSLHVRGDLGGLSFGARLRNGHVMPWAAGPRPGGALADNAQLSGSASWSGRLLGLTPAGAAVAGASAMTIDLGTLAGDLDFTGLESWTGGPGAAGSGALWGDGDLAYTVAVDGNVFARAGGDEGTLTGAFFGAGHQGMGGTLVRDDLSAGFAGTR